MGHKRLVTRTIRYASFRNSSSLPSSGRCPFRRDGPGEDALKGDFDREGGRDRCADERVVRNSEVMSSAGISANWLVDYLFNCCSDAPSKID